MNSHSFELGWTESCVKYALIALESRKPEPDEAIRLLRRALDETERKAAFARLQTGRAA